MRAALLVVLALAGACTHETAYVTEPPGVDVYVDGEHRGQTPLTIEEIAAGPDFRRVELVHEAERRVVRLDVEHTAFSTEMIVVGLLAGVVTFFSSGLMLLPFFAAYVTMITLVTTGATGVLPPTVYIPALFGALGVLYGSYIGAILIAAASPTVALAVVGEGARKGPDEIFVDFEHGEVSTSPGGLAHPLVGAPPGYRAVRVREGDGDSLSEDEESP